MSDSETIGADAARQGFADLLNRAAYGRERIRIGRGGKPIAALVSIEDLELIEAFEDTRDIEDARRVLADDDGERVTLDELKAELDL